MECAIHAAFAFLPSICHGRIELVPQGRTREAKEHTKKKVKRGEREREREQRERDGII